jgi:hypothetical protein
MPTRAISCGPAKNAHEGTLKIGPKWCAINGDFQDEVSFNTVELRPGDPSAVTSDSEARIGWGYRSSRLRKKGFRTPENAICRTRNQWLARLIPRGKVVFPQPARNRPNLNHSAVSEAEEESRKPRLNWSAALAWRACKTICSGRVQQPGSALSHSGCPRSRLFLIFGQHPYIENIFSLSEKTRGNPGNRARVRATYLPIQTVESRSPRGVRKGKNRRRGVHWRPNRIELSLLFSVKIAVSH